MSKADTGRSTGEDHLKPSRRRALSIMAAATPAIAGGFSTLPAFASASAGKSTVAQLFDVYVIARNDVEAWCKAYRAAAERCAAMAPEPPLEILQPNPLLRHRASSPPGHVLKDDPPNDRIFYRPRELRKLLDADHTPPTVRAEAEYLLPIADKFEAAQKVASELSGAAAFDDESLNVVCDVQNDARAAVMEAPLRDASDFAFKARVIQDLWDVGLEADAECSALVDQILDWFGDDRIIEGAA